MKLQDVIIIFNIEIFNSIYISVNIHINNVNIVDIKQ